MGRVAQVLDVLENHLPGIEETFRGINSGGCGIMAEIIAEQLDLLKINYSIVCRGGWGFSGNKTITCEDVNNAIDENDKHKVPNSHILVRVGGRCFDSEGGQDLEDKRIAALIDRPTIQRMIDMDCWNSYFDRSQTEDMRVFTGKVFKKRIV